MASSVSFTGTLQSSNTNEYGCQPGAETTIGFQNGPLTFGAVAQTMGSFKFGDSQTWVRVPFTDELAEVQLLGLSALNGTSTELLIGTVPVWYGIGGVFPTGFTGAVSFTFVLRRSTLGSATPVEETFVTVWFDAPDQTAADVAKRINITLMEIGVPKLVTVGTNGQLVITGTQPGEVYSIDNYEYNAAIGFDEGNVGARGIGAPQRITGVYLAQFADVPATHFWLRGGCQLQVIAAGNPL